MDKMIDMARKSTAANKNEVVGGDDSKYPYGLSLRLDDETLKKLGLNELPDVGDEFHIMAVGKVTSTSENADGDNKSSNVSIQITQMCVSEEAEDADEDDQERKGAFSMPGMKAR